MFLSVSRNPEDRHRDHKCTGCAYRELDPAAMMMKFAEDWPYGELAEPLDRPMARRILVQGQMCSDPV